MKIGKNCDEGDREVSQATDLNKTQAEPRSLEEAANSPSVSALRQDIANAINNSPVALHVAPASELSEPAIDQGDFQRAVSGPSPPTIDQGKHPSLTGCSSDSNGSLSGVSHSGRSADSGTGTSIGSRKGRSWCEVVSHGRSGAGGGSGSSSPSDNDANAVRPSPSAEVRIQAPCVGEHSPSTNQGADGGVF